MKMAVWSKQMMYTLTKAFSTCLKRFPVTIGFVMALTAYLISLIQEFPCKDTNLWFTCGYLLTMGTLLSLSLHLWSEEVTHKEHSIITQIVMYLLLLADTANLYHSLINHSPLIEILIARASIILVTYQSIFLLSFFREKNDIAQWNFTSTAIGIFNTVLVISLILGGGLCLLLFSLQKLFDFSIHWHSYLYLIILCNFTLPLILLMGLLPQGNLKHNTHAPVSAFKNGTLYYLFLPLITGYLLVLYAYAIRILYRWELPNGWVSWLVTALMTGCIGIEYALYPTRIKHTNRLNEAIARWLPALALPLLLLMSIGIARRLNDYGVTINRLYLATLNGWFYLVCIGLLVNKTRRICWIPISFGIVFLLTSFFPFNYTRLTQHILHHKLKEKLTQTYSLTIPLSTPQYKTWLTTLSQPEAQAINSQLKYLKNWYGSSSIADLTQPDVSFYMEHESQHTDTQIPIRYWGEMQEGKQIPLPIGYSHMIPITHMPVQEVPRNYLQGQRLAVPLGKYSGESTDSVYLDLTQLRAIHQAQSSPLPIPINCYPLQQHFIMTAFNLQYTPHDTSMLQVSINGYLFKK